MNISHEPVNIVLADNQELIIEGLKTILKENFTISATVSSGSQVVDAINRYKPDLVIMDVAQLDFISTGQIGELVSNNPDTTLIVLTNSINRKEVIELNECGIKNIITKWVEKEELLECIDAALRRKKYYSQQVLEMLMEPEKKNEYQNIQGLTASEIEIVRLLSQGLTNKEIASKKFLSVHTIMTHRKNIMRKLGVSNVSEMMMIAIRSGLIDNIEYHI